MRPKSQQNPGFSLVWTLVLTLLLGACRADNTLGPPVDFDAMLEGDLELAPRDLVLSDGQSGFVSARFVSASGVVTNLPSDAEVKWSSNTPEIATVSESGTVLGKQPGVAEITAETSAGVARLPVIVMPTPTDLRPMFDGNLGGAVGKSLPDSVGIRVVDKSGLPVAGVEVSFAVETGAGAVSPESGITNGDGSVRVQWRLGNVAGRNELRVSAEGLEDAWVYAEASANPDEDQLQLIGGNEQTGMVNSVLGEELTVRVIDQHGNPVDNARLTWVFTDGGRASDGSETASATHSTSSDGQGFARIQWRLGTEAGRQEARVLVGTNGAEAWFGAVASSEPTTKVVVTPEKASIGLTDKMTLTGTPLDQYGNVVTGETILWDSEDPSVATVNPISGEVVGVSVGTTRILGSADGASGAATITVMAKGPGQLRHVSGSGQSAAVSTKLSNPFIARVLDSGGNPLAGVNVSWTVTAGGGSVDASTNTTDSEGYARMGYTVGSTAQLNQVTATVAGLTPLTFSASAVGGSLSRISVSPNNVTMALGEERNLVASALDEAGNGIGGTTFQWSSSNPGIATVDAVGEVKGIAEGQATISASASGHTGSATVTIGTPSGGGLSLDITSATLNAIGDTVQVMATGPDGSGSPEGSGAIRWVSETPNVVGVDGSGRIYTKSVGQGRVRATLGGQSATVTINSRQVVANIGFGPANPSVAVGSSLQLVASPVDSNGVTIGDDQSPNISWESGDTGIATVSSTGLVQGVAEGSTPITVAWQPNGSTPGQALSNQAPVQVTEGSEPPTDPDPPTDPPPPPPPYNGQTPELPRESINTTYVAPNGNILRVPSGGDLQGAIDQAQPGDQILLAANGVYVGNFVLPAKSGSEWIVIRTETTLPPQGTRMTPAAAASANLARVESADGFSPTFRGAPGSHHYRLMGLEVTSGANVPDQGEIIGFGGGMANHPKHIIIDRVYAHGRYGAEIKRCVGLSTAYGAVVDSYLDNCTKFGQDSQAILVWDGPGPIKIVNNYLAAAGENVMIGGGGDPSVNGLVPSDIEIRRNYLHKPDSWFYTPVGSVKNLFELKAARRVLFEGNILEGNWSDAQTGWGVLIKSTNQYGACTWCVTENVTMRYNVMTRMGNGISILRTNSLNNPSGITNNILIEHNIIDALGGKSGFPGDVSWGSGFYLSEGPQNITIRHNTVMAEYHTILMGGGPASGMVIADNLTTHGVYGIHSSAGAGSIAIQTHMPGGTFVGNVIAAADPSQYPSNNHYPSSVGAIGFNSGSYVLSSSSPYKGLASDGTDPGADIAQVNAQTAGVR